MTFARLWQIHNILQNSAEEWYHRVTWEPLWLSYMAQVAQVSVTFWLYEAFYLSFYVFFFFSSFSLSKPLMTGRWSHTWKIKNLVVTNNKFFKWDNTEFIAPFSSTGCVILQSVTCTRLSFLIQNAHFMGLLWWSNKVRQSTISKCSFKVRAPR